MNQILTYIINLVISSVLRSWLRVEHEEQLRFLKEIGCDYIQDFCLASPEEDHVPKQLQLYQNKMELL